MTTSKVLLAVCALATVAHLMTPPDAAPDVTFPSLAVAIASFVALVIVERRKSGLSPGLILGVGAVLFAAAIAFPPHGSHDVWSYAMYGRILAVHHHNPYVWLPARFPHDPFLQLVSHGWRWTGSVYGPVFNLLSGGVALIAGSSAVAARAMYQLLAAIPTFAAAVALARRGAPTWALVALVVNPLVVIQVVSGAHNDAIVGSALLGAALAAHALRPKPVVVGLFLALAIGVKAVAMLPAIAAGVWMWRKVGLRAAAITTAATGVPLAAVYGLFGWHAAFGPLTKAANMTSRATMWRLQPIVTFAHHTGMQVRVVSLVVVAAITIAAVVRQLRAGSIAGALAAGAMGYLAGAAYVLPWYLAWALPVAALASSTRLFKLLLAQSCVLLIASEYQFARHPDMLDRILRKAVIGAQWFALAACVMLVVARVRDDRPQPARQQSMQPAAT